MPADRLVGSAGDGWRQVTSELAFERSGLERFISSFQLLLELMRRAGIEPIGRAQRRLPALDVGQHCVRGLDRGERFVPVEPQELDGAQIVDFGHAGFHFVELRKSGRTD